MVSQDFENVYKEIKAYIYQIIPASFHVLSKKKKKLIKFFSETVYGATMAPGPTAQNLAEADQEPGKENIKKISGLAEVEDESVEVEEIWENVKN